jgi:anti-anti-sigma factor
MHKAREVKSVPRNSGRSPRLSNNGAARLHTETDRCGHAVILRARGEVDAHTLPDWCRVLRDTAAHAPMIVDITGLDFIGCSGLAALANQADACREHGTSLGVVSRTSIVHRIAAATGLDARLAIYPTTEAALQVAASGNSATSYREEHP